MLETKTGLQFDHWYKFVAALGAAGVGAATTVEMHGIANLHAPLFSLGVLCFGLGEWINHPFQTILIAPNPTSPGGGRLSGHPRGNRPTGVILVLTGLALMATAVYKIAQAS